MRRLGSTLAHLARMRAASAVAARTSAPPASPSRLRALKDFGANPGALVGRTFVPASLAPGAALVVVLHGCTQSAASYDQGSGWSDLAERHGFALLYPEQTRANNPNLCFNWYQANDRRRGGGEAASIAGMVRHMIKKHRLDPTRVFVTGLSAGGAMTMVMIATYPELFAGAAVIAGLPYGTAEGVPEALERMRGQGFPARPTSAGRARKAADHAGPWPTLSVWHGTADGIVSPLNAGAIVEQWADRIGLDAPKVETDTLDGHRRTIWRDAGGTKRIEQIDLGGMGHGTPLSRGGYGALGPHMLDAGICSTSQIAASWGIAPLSAPRARRPAAPAQRPPQAQTSNVIDQALRAAGLMR